LAGPATANTAAPNRRARTIQKTLKTVACRKEISRLPRASTSKSSNNSAKIKPVNPTQAHTGNSIIVPPPLRSELRAG
jgi:hypothetical protein